MRVSEIWNESFIELSLIYAREYERDGRAFISSFLKFGSIRTACDEVVRSYKKTGAMAECRKSGKDFSEYCGRFEIEQRWRVVLADTLLIIWNLKN